MSILIAEDNVAQRHYLREILEKEFSSHTPIVEAADGEETVLGAGAGALTGYLVGRRGRKRVLIYETNQP